MNRDPLEGSSPHDIDRPPPPPIVGGAQPGGSKLKFVMVVAGMALAVIVGAAVFLGSSPKAPPLPQASASPSPLASASPSSVSSSLAPTVSVPSASATMPPPPAPATTPAPEVTPDSGSGREVAPAGSLSHGKTD